VRQTALGNRVTPRRPSISRPSLPPSRFRLLRVQGEYLACTRNRVRLEGGRGGIRLDRARHGQAEWIIGSGACVGCSRCGIGVERVGGGSSRGRSCGWLTYVGANVHPVTKISH